MDRPHPIPKADNLRSHRRRKREGKMVVRVEVGTEQIDLLVELGLLQTWDETDARKVSLGITKLIDAAATEE